jgi:transaldolase
VKYVEELIAPLTVNTMPRETIAAYRTQGKPALRMKDEIPGAAAIFSGLQGLGINMATVADQLEKEGVKKFIEPFDKLQASIEERRIKLKAS